MSFSLIQKERLYGEIEKLLRAGFSIDDAARAILERGPPPPSRRYLQSLRDGVASGLSISEAIAETEVELSSLEITLVEAGERGGRIDEAYGHLAEYFGLLDRTRKRIISSLIYPIILLHVAVILPAIPKAILAGDPALATRSIVGTLLVIYILVAAMAAAGVALSRRGRKDAGIDRILRAIPLIGKARKSLALSRFCSVFRVHLLAALPVTEGLRAAAESAQSGLILGAAEKAAKSIEEGSSLAEGIAGNDSFPVELVSSLSTAELSGTLDVDLERWGRIYRESSIDAMDAVGGWVPKVLYVLVVLYVVWQIVNMGMGYLGALEGYLEP